MSTREEDEGWFPWIPWLVKALIGELAFVGVFMLVADRFLGLDWSWSRFLWVVVPLSIGAVFADNGLRRSPRIIESRLKKLFLQSEEPDFVEIASVLSDSGRTTSSSARGSS